MVEDWDIDVWVIHRKGQNYSIIFDRISEVPVLLGHFSFHKPGNSKFSDCLRIAVASEHCKAPDVLSLFYRDSTWNEVSLGAISTKRICEDQNVGHTGEGV